MNKICTSIEQSKKLIELGIDMNTADMCYHYIEISRTPFCLRWEKVHDDEKDNSLPAWSLSALLKLIPKRILRKDKIHYGQAFTPSFRWEITPAAIYYTDGNNIMDYISFGYGENNIELIDAVFKMVCWLKENGRI